MHLLSTGVPLPKAYRDFIGYLQFINFDLSLLASAGCVWNNTFYDTLLIATLVPLGIVATLGALYWLFRNSQNATGFKGTLYVLFVRKSALLILSFTFLIFSASSTVVFQVRQFGPAYVHAIYVQVICSSLTASRFQQLPVVQVALNNQHLCLVAKGHTESTLEDDFAPT